MNASLITCVNEEFDLSDIRWLSLSGFKPLHLEDWLFFASSTTLAKIDFQVDTPIDTFLCAALPKDRTRPPPFPALQELFFDAIGFEKRLDSSASLLKVLYQVLKQRLPDYRLQKVTIENGVGVLRKHVASLRKVVEVDWDEVDTLC